MQIDQSMNGVSKRELWERHLEQWRASGLSMRGYCRREGVSFNGLRYWKDKLGGDHRERRAVKVSMPVGTAPGLLRVIEVVVADRFTVRVPDGFEASELGRLIASLEAL